MYIYMIGVPKILADDILCIYKHKRYCKTIKQEYYNTLNNYILKKSNNVHPKYIKLLFKNLNC